MADVENQSRNGEGVSTRTPRRSAAGNKAWQALIPHHKSHGALQEEEDEAHGGRGSATPPMLTPAPATSSSAKGRGKSTAPPVTAAARKSVVAAASAAPVAPPRAPPTVTAASAAAAPPPPPAAHSAASSRAMSAEDDEELEEASSELYPQPPAGSKKPQKRKGRPPKNGGADEGSSTSSTPSMNKKVKMEDEYDEDDDDDGGPPMLNRQTSGAPAYRRACSPTCTKRCCLTEDGKRVSRQTTTGVRSDQFDPPYGSRPGGSKARKPRAPKLASETASPKGARAPYGSRKGEMMKPMIMPMSSDRGGSFGSAPGARSMQAISSGRAVSTMPQRSGAASQQGMMGMGGGGVSRVVAIGPGGKVQALPRATLSSPASALSVARPRMPAGGTLASALSAATAGGGGQTRYPVAVASTGPSSRLPGPSELVRAENTVDTQYKQTRAAFAHHVVPGSSAIEFNRVIDLLTVENKRLIAGQTDEQEYVDGLHRRIRSLENNVASLQRQLAVTTKAYHGALLELNAERDEALPPAATSVHAAPAPAAASSVFRPSGGAAGLGGGGGGAGSGVARATLASGKVVKPETKEEKPKEEEEEHEEGGLTAPAGGSSAPARVVAAPAGAGTAGGRGPVPRLLEAGSQGAGSSAAAAAAMMLNREQWMEEIEDEDEEYYDEMMEEMDDEEMSYFGEEEIVETEEGDNMGLD